MTKTVLETALEAELSEHLGYDRHDPAGLNRANSRNGHRAKTVLTELGPVELDVPRDREGTFEPVIVRKRQRRLDPIDELALSLTAPGLTSGEIAAHFFLRLDQLLPSERSGGRPSRVDFEAHELLRAVEEFATGFDDMPPLIPGRADYRVLIATGRLVFAYTILGQLARDGAVELTDIEVQFTPPPTARPDDEDDAGE